MSVPRYDRQGLPAYPSDGAETFVRSADYDALAARLANEEATAEWRKLRLAEAVNCLQEIAAMSKKIGSETAAHWLQQHGYPREPDGYVPGRGYTDSAPEGQP